MAYTERMFALQKVREAKKAMVEARSTPGLSSAQVKLLEDLYIDLDCQEDSIIMEAIDEKIDDLRTAGKRLEKTAKKISKDKEKLQKVAELVEKAAKALKILADITSTVGKLGLL